MTSRLCSTEIIPTLSGDISFVCKCNALSVPISGFKRWEVKEKRFPKFYFSAVNISSTNDFKNSGVCAICLCFRALDAITVKNCKYNFLNSCIYITITSRASLNNLVYFCLTRGVITCGQPSVSFRRLNFTPQEATMYILSTKSKPM